MREIDELVAIMARLREELGDLLFALVNVIRRMGLDAGHALRRGNDKFAGRFRQMQRRQREGYTDPADCDLATMDAAWEAVKQGEKT